MPRRNGGTGWRVVGATVAGASHLRSGLPNQDAIGWLPQPGVGPPLVLAVSDGHGSVKCFRSDVGAALAVDTALAVLQDLISHGSNADTLSLVKRTAEEQIPVEVVRRWVRAVDDHRSTDENWAKDIASLAEREGEGASRAVEANPALAYGATLLAVVLTETFTVFVQLGDGDMLTVSEAGVVERPLPRDERLFANETTSLCSANAWRDFRVRFQAISGSPPAVVLLSTDGYCNSFRDDAGFLQVGKDLLDIIRTDGVEAVNRDLQAWLDEASQQGSGDDITLGVLCRLDLTQAPDGSDDALDRRDRGG